MIFCICMLGLIYLLIGSISTIFYCIENETISEFDNITILLSIVIMGGITILKVISLLVESKHNENIESL